MAVKKREGISPPTLIAEVTEDLGMRETQIEEYEDWNPQCVLPENYFDYALSRDQGAQLSITRWDGTEILRVIRRQ